LDLRKIKTIFSKHLYFKCYLGIISGLVQQHLLKLVEVNNIMDNLKKQLKLLEVDVKKLICNKK
jgi:hypothetical protein